MPEGKIFQFPQNPDDRERLRKQAQEKKDSAKDSSLRDQEIKKFLDESPAQLRTWLDAMMKMPPKIKEIQTFLTSLKGPVSKHAITEKVVALRALPLQEIVEQLKNSTEQNWRKNPAYFYALVAVFEEKFDEPPKNSQE